MKARTLGSHERAHRTHCVRRRRATLANLEGRRTRTSEPSSDATVERWNRREPLGDLGALCVMHAPSHAKNAKVAKKDRFTVASHSGLRRECHALFYGGAHAQFSRKSAPHLVCDVDVRRWRISKDVEPERRSQAPTLQWGGSFRTAVRLSRRRRSLSLAADRPALRVGG